MPTSYKVKNALMSSLPVDFEGDIFECGAGFGTLAIALAKKFPHKNIFAYELSPLPFLVLKTLKKILFLKNLKVLRKDFFLADFKRVGLIVCYLYPAGMQKLGNKFANEVESGSYLISNTFSVYSMQPIKVIKVNDLYATSIYFYHKQLK